jgi:chromosome segregation ATPase
MSSITIQVDGDITISVNGKSIDQTESDDAEREIERLINEVETLKAEVIKADEATAKSEQFRDVLKAAQKRLHDEVRVAREQGEEWRSRWEDAEDERDQLAEQREQWAKSLDVIQADRDMARNELLILRAEDKSLTEITNATTGGATISG